MWWTLLSMAACTFSLPQEPEEEEVWELVFEDEFDGRVDARPSAENWTFDIGNGPEGLPGWGNGEIQYYTDRADNIGLTGDGFLRITAKREQLEGFGWTSARIKSKDLVEIEYGRIEARIKAPIERGIWPAFWMLGNDIDEVGWPVCGEIDIMEIFGDDRIGVALHGPGYSGGNPVFRTFGGAEEGFEDEFHVYSVIWDPDHIAWTIDGELVGTASRDDTPANTPWVFDHPFYLLLNVAVGGAVPPPTADTPNNNDVLINWVRMYKRADPVGTDPLIDTGAL